MEEIIETVKISHALILLKTVCITTLTALLWNSYCKLAKNGNATYGFVLTVVLSAILTYGVLLVAEI